MGKSGISFPKMEKSRRALVNRSSCGISLARTLWMPAAFRGRISRRCCPHSGAVGSCLVGKGSSAMFDWIKRKTPEPALPSPRAEPDRYKGRPLLIILENYVLSCIGHLTAEEEPEWLRPCNASGKAQTIGSKPFARSSTLETLSIRTSVICGLGTSHRPKECGDPSSGAVRKDDCRPEILRTF